MMEEGTFCYKRMLFRLKNAWVTYPRLVKKMFEYQKKEEYGSVYE